MASFPPNELNSGYTSLGAKTGRVIREDGTTVNFGDMILSNPEYASREGRFYRAFWFGQVPALTTYFFNITIPAGIKLYGFNRVSTVLGGRLNTTFLVGGTPGTVEDTADGFNFDETLSDTSASTLQRVAMLTGAGARTPPIPIVSPTSGPVRTPSTQTESGLQPAFSESFMPGFQYENPDDTATPTLYLQLTWQEILV